MGSCQASQTSKDSEFISQEINFIVPPGENPSEIDKQTLSKQNIQNESEDFAYIGTNDLKGFEQFKQIFDQLELQQALQFQDKDFPNQLESLILKQHSSKTDWKYKYQWKRPHQFFQQKYQLFLKSLTTFQNTTQKVLGAEGIEPDDIKQGELGDCYFLATISAIAEYPSRIKKIFITRKINNYGIYCVKLCHFGEWQAVFVDDYFPCNQQGPAFTRGNSSEIWVLVLEKAWAKLYGSYEKIEAGFTQEALKSLTSAPTQNIWTNIPESELWETIQNADQEKYIMTCGTSSQSQAEKVGLVPGHAYTLIGCALYQGTKLIRLRNPWGSREWRGNWSDQDRIWTNDLRNQLNHNPDSNDGAFYMELTDFQKYFPVMQVCYYKDNYQYTSYKIESNAKHASIIKMKVLQSSDYYISVNQESKRMHSDYDNYKYSNCKLLIAKVDYNTKKFEWIGAKQYNDFEFWINAYLTPGDYIIYVKTYWQNNESRSFVVSSYGSQKVRFEQVFKSSFPLTYLSNIMMAHPKQKLQHYQNIEGITKHFEMYQKEGFGIFWIKNTGNQLFKTKIELTKMDGLKLRKPYRGNIIEFNVQPNEELIALANVDPNSYFLQYSESYQA